MQKVGNFILETVTTPQEHDIELQAYILAEQDGFTKNSEYYWKGAIKELTHGNIEEADFA